MKKFVRVFIRNSEGKYLLLHEKDTGWNLPGGKVEKKEFPSEAYRREVEEELNLIISGGGEIFSGEFIFWGDIWQGFFFEANVKNIEEICIKEPEKCDKFEFFTLEELINLEEHLRDLRPFINVALHKGLL